MTREEREEMQRTKATLSDALLPKRVPAWKIALSCGTCTECKAIMPLGECWCGDSLGCTC